jgi:hypothetical protein
MAINKISGNILQDDLVRGANLSVQGNLVFFDVANDRVGVLTSSPQDEFNVLGVANASNVRITSSVANGVFYADATQLALTDGNFAWDGNTLSVIGNISSSNVTVLGNIETNGLQANSAVLGNVSVGNIDVTGAVVVESLTSNTFVTATGNVSGGNITTTGAVDAVGNVTGGNLITAGEMTATGNITGGNLAVGNVIQAGNLVLSGTQANSVLFTNADNVVVTDSNLVFDGSAFEIQGSMQVDNVTIDGTDISSDANLSVITANNGDLVFDIDGTGIAKFESTTSLGVPVGNTAQRPAVPDQGALRFNTSIGLVEVYDGVQWEVVGSNFVSITNQVITGDGSTTIFTLDESTTSAAIIVATNGVVQQPDVAYTVAANLITFAEAPLSTDVIDVRFTAAVTTFNSITNLSGNASISMDSSGVANLSTVQSLQLPSYTVAEATGLANAASGQLIYVSNGDSGQPCLAVYSVDAWKVVSLGANISSV